jgi:hypothetical protein
MFRFRWLQVLHALGVEFWLLLPLLGLGFWFSSGVLTDRILNRFYKTENYLQIDNKQDRQSVKRIRAITVFINEDNRTSTVNVRIGNDVLQSLKFEFPFTAPEQLEDAISRELGLPHDQVRELVVYRREQY